MTPAEVEAIIARLRMALQAMTFVREDLALLKIEAGKRVTVPFASSAGAERPDRDMPNHTLKKRIERGVLTAELALREALEPIPEF